MFVIYRRSNIVVYMKSTRIYGSPVHMHSLHTIQYLYFICCGSWLAVLVAA
jgi:hypothetical protein